MPGWRPAAILNFEWELPYREISQQDRGCQSEPEPKRFQNEMVYLGHATADRGKSDGQAVSSPSCSGRSSATRLTGANIAQPLGRRGEKGNHCSGHLNAIEPLRQ